MPLSSITPSAAYRARNASRATSATFCSTRSSDGSVVSARLACMSACICALSSAAMRSRRASSSRASASALEVSAFSMTMPACEASISATCSSASENSPPPCFSVMHRWPYAWSRTMIGTPRNDSVGGWLAGTSPERECAASRRIRIGRRSLIKSPSTPCPVGSRPIAAFPASSIPAVSSWLSPGPVSSITPSTAYRAHNTSRATSAIFCSTRSSDGSIVTARLACISASGRADEAQVIAVSSLFTIELRRRATMQHSNSNSAGPPSAASWIGGLCRMIAEPSSRHPLRHLSSSCNRPDLERAPGSSSSESGRTGAHGRTNAI